MNLKALIDAETPAVAIFGKSWLLHVTKVLGATPEEGLAMIADSVAFLKENGKEVVYDAEHFFDGYRDDPDFAMKAVKAAAAAGADWVVLCDTNGGSLPSWIMQATKAVRAEIKVPLGIHTHNDGELAVANSLAAIEAGATQVQGTINGYGERCGNANLVSVIPGLQLKMGKRCVADEQLQHLTDLSRTITEIVNMRPNDHAPYVGMCAFAHKGGVHVAAVEKVAASYEHIPPERVGNHRKVVISELAGRGNVRIRAKELGLELSNERDLLDRIKVLENQGYQFEAAEGSFELLVRRADPGYVAPFELIDVISLAEQRQGREMLAEAIVKVRVNGAVVHTAAEGDGPVHALDRALRKALLPTYPSLAAVALTDYKVRILDPESHTDAKTRVLIDAALGEERWSTIGVSQNLIEASWQALADSFELHLLRTRAAATEPKAMKA
jgi:2-isopropylmalate synthase